MDQLESLSRFPSVAEDRARSPAPLKHALQRAGRAAGRFWKLAALPEPFGALRAERQLTGELSLSP